jgi:hypothetical protein
MRELVAFDIVNRSHARWYGVGWMGSFMGELWRERDGVWTLANFAHLECGNIGEVAAVDERVVVDVYFDITK